MPLQNDEHLLKLYESGLPGWAIFLGTYTTLYRPWFRKASWLLFVAFSLFSMTMGFYDLYKHVPYVQQVCAMCWLHYIHVCLLSAPASLDHVSLPCTSTSNAALSCKMHLRTPSASHALPYERLKASKSRTLPSITVQVLKSIIGALPTSTLFEWLENHAQIRLSILLTFLFGKSVMFQQLAVTLKNAGQVIE